MSQIDGRSPPCESQAETMTAAATLACWKARLDQSNPSGKSKTHAIETAGRGPVKTRLLPLGELAEGFCHDCRLRRRDKLRSDEMGDHPARASRGSVKVISTHPQKQTQTGKDTLARLLEKYSPCPVPEARVNGGADLGRSGAVAIRVD